MKELEGKEVVLRPIGNEVRYRGDQPVKAKILKVARVFVTLVFEGRSYEKKYRFRGRELSDDCNGGFVVYASQQEFDDYADRLDLARKICDEFRHASDYQKVELGRLKKVAELLGVTGGEKDDE